MSARKFPLVGAVAMLIFASAVHGQQPAPAAGAEHHRALGNAHESAKAHAQNIRTHASTKGEISKEEVRREADAASQDLQKAQSELAALERDAGARGKHVEAVRRHHNSARAHHQAITNELSQPRPNKKTIRKHAEGMHKEMSGAEKERRAIEKEHGRMGAGRTR